MRNWLDGHTHGVAVNGSVSEWKAVTSDVPWGLVLGSTLLDIFVSCMDSGTECTLIKFPDDTKLCGVANMLEGGDAVQCKKPRKANKAKYEVLHLGRSSPVNTGWGMTRLRALRRAWGSWWAGSST